MTYTGVSQALDWAARLRRFRRLMMITVDAGQRGVATLTTSNLSRGGLAAIGDHTLAPGDRARIRFGGRPGIAATVAWTSGRRIGFQFDHELDLVNYLGARMRVLKRP